MRLFIAVNFSDATKNSLVSWRDELRENSSSGKFSLTENLHLTLAFLGECSAKQMTAAKSAMDALTVAPFDITIESIGRFKRDGGDIWWAGVAESNALLEFQANLIAKLREAGFALEERKYSPHITLGREVITGAEPRKIEPLGEIVTKFELMKSEYTGGKLVYTAIHVAGMCKFK